MADVCINQQRARREAIADLIYYQVHAMGIVSKTREDKLYILIKKLIPVFARRYTADTGWDGGETVSRWERILRQSLAKAWWNHVGAPHPQGYIR